MTSRTAFWDAIYDAVNAENITYNSNPVELNASYNDKDLTQEQAPFITVNPVEKTDSLNRFGNDYEEQDLSIQIYVFGDTTLAVDEVAEDVLAALPNRADDAHKEEVTTTPAFSPAQDVKMHSVTISAIYERY